MRRAKNFSHPLHSRSFRASNSLAARLRYAAVFLANTDGLASAAEFTTEMGLCLSFLSLLESTVSFVASSGSSRCFVAALSLLWEGAHLGDDSDGKPSRRFYAVSGLLSSKNGADITLRDVPTARTISVFRSGLMA